MGHYHLCIVVICYFTTFMLFCILEFIQEAKSPAQPSPTPKPHSKKQISKNPNKKKTPKNKEKKHHEKKPQPKNWSIENQNLLLR